jgi:hypothetical protein
MGEHIPALEQETEVSFDVESVLTAIKQNDKIALLSGTNTLGCQPLPRSLDSRDRFLAYLSHTGTQCPLNTNDRWA